MKFNVLYEAWQGFMEPPCQDLVQLRIEGRCSWCGDTTSWMAVSTRAYVCSEECDDKVRDGKGIPKAC